MILKYQMSNPIKEIAERIVERVNGFNGFEAFYDVLVDDATKREKYEITIEIPMDVGKQSIFLLGTLVATMDKE